MNSLFVEFPVAAERGQPPTWRPLPESPLPQLLGRGMTQSFRIRMGSGEPLSPEQIQIVPLRPFADETGDTMRLPEVASQTSADRGRSVVAVLRFPETPNAHVHLPYQVQVEVRAPEHHVPPVLATFRVHYLDPRDFFDEQCSEKKINRYVLVRLDALGQIAPPRGKLIDPPLHRVLIPSYRRDRKLSAPAIVH